MFKKGHAARKTPMLTGSLYYINHYVLAYGFPVSRSIALGIGASFIMTRVMSALLFGVGPLDPATYFLADYARIIASTSSRLASIWAGVVPSRFSRNRGSVFDGRTLKCQSGYSTDTPSSFEIVASL